MQSFYALGGSSHAERKEDAITSPVLDPPKPPQQQRACNDADAAAGPWGEYVKRSEAKAQGRPITTPVRNVVDMPGRVANPPAMLHESVDAVVQQGLQGVYVDAAFTHGMYSGELLRRLPAGSSLIIFADERTDPNAFVAAKEMMRQDARVEAVISASFDEVAEALRGRELAGAVVDLGCALHHSEDNFKGLSPIDDVPLDLRADQSQGMAASDWLRSATVAELAWVIHAYGEDDDPFTALRVAEAVHDRQRRLGNYRTIHQLADVVRRAKASGEDRGHHPARLVIQALRMFVNGEQERVTGFLSGLLPLLVPNGRVAVVSTLRWEASSVKAFLRRHEDSHRYLDTKASPRHLQELYPLLKTDFGYAAVQACQPLWPSAQDGRRVSRTLATHVLQRSMRRSSRCALSAVENGIPQAELFIEPLRMPFVGGDA